MGVKCHCGPCLQAWSAVYPLAGLQVRKSAGPHLTPGQVWRPHGFGSAIPNLTITLILVGIADLRNSGPVPPPVGYNFGSLMFTNS